MSAGMQLVKTDLGEFIATESGQELVGKAIELFREHPHPSIAAVERNLRPGFAISAAIMVELEKRGVVSAPYGNGEREYFGTGADGITAFRAFAEKLRSGIEPAAHWWRNLTPSSQRTYLAGADGKRWGDLTDPDRVKLRARYFKNLDNLRKLERQFSYRKGAGASV